MRLFVQPVRDVFQTNAYFYINEQTRHGCLIDPGAQPELLLNVARAHHWQLDAILLTHGHFDHTGAVDALTQALDIPFYIHARGPEYLQDDDLNLARQHGRHIAIAQAPHLLHDGDQLRLEKCALTLDILATPGHSFDSVTYFDAQHQRAFVGDVLYDDGPGIWEFPGGDQAQLQASISQKLGPLPLTTRYLVGHTAPMSGQQVQRLITTF